MITWLAVKTFFNKAWAWCKKYWQILVGAAIPVVIWLLTRNSNNLKEVMKKIKDDHQKELDVINESHRLEIEMREKALAEHRQRVIKIEEEHRNASIDLDNSKKKKIEKILKDNKDSPEEITRKISELTGIDVHVE